MMESSLTSLLILAMFVIFSLKEKIKLQLVTFHVDVVLESLVYVQYGKQDVFLS